MRPKILDPLPEGWTEKDVDRFFAKVEVPDVLGCWQWVASFNSHHYGQFRIWGKTRTAHRLAWSLIVGPIPVGLDLDHLCRNRGCVNPRHLEPVTRRVNTQRGMAAERTRASRAEQTHCRRGGHPLSGDNLRIGSKGERTCRTCRREQNREAKARKREAAIFAALGREIAA